MSRARYLDARTTTFLELVGSGKSYLVPPYQRDYSWTEEQWGDLWRDVVEIHEGGGPHYMGALVLEAISDRAFRIIDGQQRIATLSVLALACIRHLKDLAELGVEASENQQRSEALRSRFVGEKDPASLLESSKLSLNRIDNPFYQDRLVQLNPPPNLRRLPRSNRDLWNCFEYFRKRLRELDRSLETGAVVASFMAETVGRQLVFIMIDVEDDLSAYTVFETLNARGLELSSADLLKNYLFSILKSRSDLESLERRWHTLMLTVGQERFPEFLRFHLSCEEPHVRASRLFKLVSERVRQPEQALDLLTVLESRGEIYAALTDPNHEYWLDLPQARGAVRELQLFRVRQAIPALFAAWERFSRENFVRLLQVVSVHSFRYTVIGGLNPSALETAYHQTARAILEGHATTPGEAYERMRSVAVDDVKFQQDFAVATFETGGQKKKLVRYLLARLESRLPGSVVIDPETDPGTIEHILPENPSEAWESSIPPARWDSAIYRLGNLAFLEGPVNREIGNREFGAKRVSYEASRYGLTRRIAELAPEEWTLEHIEKRQQELARLAVTVWRNDFP